MGLPDQEKKTVMILFFSRGHRPYRAYARVAR